MLTFDRENYMRHFTSHCGNYHDCDEFAVITGNSVTRYRTRVSCDICVLSTRAEEMYERDKIARVNNIGGGKGGVFTRPNFATEFRRRSRCERNRNAIRVSINKINDAINRTRLSARLISLFPTPFSPSIPPSLGSNKKNH